MSYLVIFKTYSAVLKLEKELQKINIDFETMPAPRHLSIDCGVSIRFSSQLSIEELLQQISTTSISKILIEINDDFDCVFLNE